MKYALLIYGTEADNFAPGTPEAAELFEAYGKFTQEITADEVYLRGEALDSVDTATTVRVRNGEAITTDGPFAETKEQLGGFYLVEADDLDGAIALAERLPGSWVGSVEVRPIWQFDGMG